MSKAFLPMLLASVAVLTCGGDSATDASPTASATTEPIPTPTTAETPIPNTLVVRQIAADETLTGLGYGAIFLDTKTGNIELVTVLEPSGTGKLFSISPDNRFVFTDSGGGFLLDRETGAVWEGKDLPGRPVTGRGGLLSYDGRLVIETDAASRSYVIVDANLKEVASFSLPGLAEIPLASFPSPHNSHAVLFDGEYMVLDLADGSINPVAFQIGEREAVSVHVLIDGFALTGFNKRGADGTGPQCRIVMFSWDGKQQSEAELEPCSSSNFSRRFDVSPDGTLVAAWAILGTQEGGGPGYNPILGAVYVYDATTGEPLFRVKGAAMPAFLGAERTLWLDDSSAIVVTTRERNYLVDRSGDWVEDELPDYLPIPSPSNPLLYGVNSAPFLVNLGIPLESIQSWGVAGNEVRYWFAPQQGDFGGVAPVASPAIEFAPFGPDQLLIEGTGSCLNIHVQPDEEAETVACLPDGALVEIQPIPLDQITTGPHSSESDGPLYSAYWRPAETCEGDNGGWCLWASVRTPTGIQGWAFSSYLQWPGIRPGTE